jgi:hypothetical protein|tara:strand:+ start:13654 stop:14154 length:501 start_codon:yes stop_codon:yes gene_type:complete
MAEARTNGLDMAHPGSAAQVDRQSDTREATTRVEAWAPPSVLPDPNPRPGWVHRWIRTSMMGDADNRNVSMRMREGWEPCKIEEYPELQIMVDVNSSFEGNIEVGGLLLCKCPEEIMNQRRDYYSAAAARQEEAVDENFMRENDPRMPLLRPDKQTQTTFGRGPRG